ncbi:MAG: hypothetical protein BRC49_06835 [Cyanobacteria bacterium SW_10_48_33]|nr:MAG: hypothetical protein BRC49_06835 [Cyanobacteria bacterium SW_10_48_33]
MARLAVLDLDSPSFVELSNEEAEELTGGGGAAFLATYNVAYDSLGSAKSKKEVLKEQLAKGSAAAVGGALSGFVSGGPAGAVVGASLSTPGS